MGSTMQRSIIKRAGLVAVGFVALALVVRLVRVFFVTGEVKIVGGDEASTKALLRESGARSLIPLRGLRKDSNLVIGTVDLDMRDVPGPIRMALIIKTKEGKRITDFVEGIPAGDSYTICEENAVLEVPRAFCQIMPPDGDMKS